MRVAAAVLFAVTILVAATVITRDPSEWHPPSEEQVGNTAVAAQTARTEAQLGTTGEASLAHMFGASSIAPALTGTSAGTLMPSAASAAP